MNLKPIKWIPNQKKILKEAYEFPDKVKENIKGVIYQIQCGNTPINTKPLKDVGADIREIIISCFRGDTYRTIYTTYFEPFVCILTTFKKKSPRGNEIPQQIIERIKKRFKMAEYECIDNEEEEG